MRFLLLGWLFCGVSARLHLRRFSKPELVGARCQMIVAGSRYVGVEAHCSAVLAGGGYSPDFVINAAHATHSLFLADLRLFQANATRENGIPVVNPDLEAEIPLLANVPDFDKPYTEQFGQFAWKSGTELLDRVLSHLGSHDWGFRYSRIEEKFIHAWHMRDILATAVKHYQGFKKHPPSAAECNCALDARVLDVLGLIARVTRQPDLIFHHIGQYSIGTKSYVSINEAGEVVLAKAAAPDALMPDPVTWARDKDRYLSMSQDCAPDAALYLYCALH